VARVCVCVGGGREISVEFWLGNRGREARRDEAISEGDVKVTVLQDRPVCVPAQLSVHSEREGNALRLCSVCGL